MIHKKVASIDSGHAGDTYRCIFNKSLSLAFTHTHTHVWEAKVFIQMSICSSAWHLHTWLLLSHIYIWVLVNSWSWLLLKALTCDHVWREGCCIKSSPEEATCVYTLLQGVGTQNTLFRESPNPVLSRPFPLTSSAKLIDYAVNRNVKMASKRLKKKGFFFSFWNGFAYCVCQCLPTDSMRFRSHYYSICQSESLWTLFFFFK